MDELSGLSVGAADAAATAAREVADGTADVAADVDRAVASLGGWWGVARDGFAEQVLALDRHVQTLQTTARAGAQLVAEYARDLGMLQGQLARVDAGRAQVQTRIDAGVGDLASWHADWAELDRWEASRRVVLAEFDELTQTFAARVFAVVDQVPRRPRRLGEHVDDAARTVGGALLDGAYLAAGWAWDRPGWTGTVRSLPAATLDAVVHPVRTLADAVAWDDWRDGRYGAAGATLGMAFVGRSLRGGPLGKTLPEGHPLRKHLDDDGNPEPQSVDELYGGVDLGRSEVFFSAHTLGRHVDVDDEFLKRRLETGQVEDGVVQRRPPPFASRFTDRETAEAVITGALKASAPKINEAIDRGESGYEFSAPAPAGSGVIWRKTAAGDFETVEVSTVKVVLLEADDGSWYVHTAYLEGAQ
ncbi:RNase A-like domain-containing protein [Kineococcus sp. NPDC059986]|uniref:RNase A-like domain-containing protein n=1 Tax=Kineococcus sp. NPDC059986 TaxID=3155538 RepID=UPI00344EB65E